MKKISAYILGLVFVLPMILSSCEEEVGEAPELPPYETMVMSFNGLVEEKSSSMNDIEQASIKNWLYSGITVGVWNTILAVNLVIPVAAFEASFNNLPVYVGESTWQWSYEIPGVGAQYYARLRGEVVSDGVNWEMHIRREGFNPFDETLWFYGFSSKDRLSGNWVLNHSADHPEEMLRIDWVRNGEALGEIKYTYIREKNNMNEVDAFNGSYIQYGRQDGDLDLFYNVHAYNAAQDRWEDTEIEMSEANKYGHVKAAHYFNDELWHCWNMELIDVSCE